MPYRILLRRDLSQNWNYNDPVLMSGEPGYEMDTRKFKMGDGQTPWSQLPYYLGATGPVGVAGPTGPTGPSGDATLTSVTYDELVDLIDTSALTPGSSYLITDFRTCYDQPDFNSFRNGIIGDNYKESAIEPIVVFATSTDTISSTAYQPNYPKDRIQYDWTFNQTERTNGVAYGRITERIDEFNNRTDYDHRTILFKRYSYIEIDVDNPLPGTVTVTPTSSTEMDVIGVNTNFESLTVGQYIGFSNDNFRAYEITGIDSNTEMYITGLTNTNLGAENNIYPVVTEGNGKIYYQNNISTDYTEHYTFDYENININNYIGDFANLYNYEEPDFILANNVFQGFSNNYINNTFGDACYNNSFRANCGDNTIGNYFYNNTTDNNFNANLIGNSFFGNRITAAFERNRIGENFYNNYIVQNEFYRNNIMNSFNSNIISGNDFQNNEIGNQFQGNLLRNGQFYKNDIGNDYNNNKIYSDFYGNKIGNNFDGNIISGYFYNNTIPDNFTSNTIGDYFQWNIINTVIASTDFTADYGNITDFTYSAGATGLPDALYSLLSTTTNGNGVNATFDVDVSGGVVSDVNIDNSGKLYNIGNTLTISGTDIGGVSGAISGFVSDGIGKTGSNGIYNAIIAGGTGSGENASFNITVTSDLVSNIEINDAGVGYKVDDLLVISGDSFGGTNGSDDITIEVTSVYSDDITITVTDVSPNPSVYEPYTCQIFEKKLVGGGTNKRLSFYDENDILTITNITE